MSEHLKLYCLLIEPIAEPDKILLGVTLNPAISLVNTNGRAHSPNTVAHQIWLVFCLFKSGVDWGPIRAKYSVINCVDQSEER